MHDEKDHSMINLQDAADYLVAAGWSVTANDDPLLPFKIQRGTQEYSALRSSDPSAAQDAVASLAFYVGIVPDRVGAIRESRTSLAEAVA